jgi:hypothetical protein
MQRWQLWIRCWYHVRCKPKHVYSSNLKTRNPAVIGWMCTRKHLAKLPVYPQYIFFEWLYTDNSNTAFTVSPGSKPVRHSLRQRPTYGVLASVVLLVDGVTFSNLVKESMDKKVKQSQPKSSHNWSKNEIIFVSSCILSNSGSNYNCHFDAKGKWFVCSSHPKLVLLYR